MKHIFLANLDIYSKVECSCREAENPSTLSIVDLCKLIIIQSLMISTPAKSFEDWVFPLLYMYNLTPKSMTMSWIYGKTYFCMKASFSHVDSSFAHKLLLDWCSWIFLCKCLLETWSSQTVNSNQAKMVLVLVWLDKISTINFFNHWNVIKLQHCPWKHFSCSGHSHWNKNNFYCTKQFYLS